MGTPIVGNYYARPDFFDTDVATGVTRDREGTRIVGLTDDFLRGFHKGLEEAQGALLEGWPVVSASPESGLARCYRALAEVLGLL